MKEKMIVCPKCKGHEFNLRVKFLSLVVVCSACGEEAIRLIDSVQFDIDYLSAGEDRGRDYIDGLMLIDSL